MGKAVNIPFFLIFLILLIISFFQSTIAQNQWRITTAQNNNYLPQYNLWLPCSYQKNINCNQPFVSDSIFTWKYYQFSFPFAFNDIYFIDSIYGYAIYRLTGYAGGIVRTTDGGLNWDSTGLKPGGSCYGLYFTDRNTGWVVGSSSLIRKTTNGGMNWIAQDSFGYGIYYNNFNSVHFFNPDTGMIIGERAIGYPNNSWGGCVLKTTNGGTNWNQIYSTNDTIYSSTELNGQYWLNNETGWIAGYNILLKTTDGGVSFANYYSHIPPTQNEYNLLLSIFFTNSETGWIGGGNVDHKNIYKTTNAGSNWFFQDNPVAQYFSSASSHVIFLTPYTGWAAVYYLGVILATTNGGTNWVIDKMANTEFYRFSIYRKTKIWCAAAGGQIWYATIDGPIGLQNHQEQVPNQFMLFQNFPNPFNPITKIRFDIPSVGQRHAFDVQLIVYDMLGSEIAMLVDKQLSVGTYNIEWNASDYPSGVYFYKLQTDDYSVTKKMVLIK